MADDGLLAPLADEEDDWDLVSNSCSSAHMVSVAP